MEVCDQLHGCSIARRARRFFAAQTVVVGPLRHVAAARQLGRFRSEADMAGPAADLVAVENDPSQT